MKARLAAAGAAFLLAACAGVPALREEAPEDARFEPLSSDPRVLYEPGAEHHAERVAALLPAAIGQVEAAHYEPFAAPVAVHVCASEECFARSVAGAHRFAAAVAYDNRLVLAPRLFEREPERLYPVLVHELSHLHLGQRLGHYTMRIPVWFHEGLASLAARGGGADLVSDEEALRAAAAGRHFLPDVRHDETRRSGAERWQLAISIFYRQSMLFLADLRARAEERFRRLLLGLQQRARFDEAFEAAFGASARQLAQEFFGRLRCSAPSCAAAASP